MAGFCIRVIHEAEAGMKVLRFLERITGLPRPLLYRLLRTGAVRLNGGRVQGDRVLRSGDELKYPIKQLSGVTALVWEETSGHRFPQKGDVLGSGLRIVYRDDAILVLDKPSGMPSQPGSGHGSGSVSEILRAAFAGAPYIPAPAHRLDKESGGLLLAGMTYAAQRHLHELFKEGKGTLQRDYLASVEGEWPYDEAYLLQDAFDVMVDHTGKERVQSSLQWGHPCAAPHMPWLAAMGLCHSCSHGEEPAQAFSLQSSCVGKGEAQGIFLPVGVRMFEGGIKQTVLAIRLLTGKKHQIRVQCAVRGHPLVGDVKYGAAPAHGLMLHAAHLHVPESVFLAASVQGSSMDFVSLPPWVTV